MKKHNGELLRQWRKENPEKLFKKGSLAKNGLKKCSKCQLIKNIIDFWNDKKSLDGLTCQCKSCLSYKKTKFNLYKISEEFYLEILHSQNNSCAICQTNLNGRRSGSIDHCHITGKVRGILCHRCNTGIGLLKDDENNLKKAIKYLDENNG